MNVAQEKHGNSFSVVGKPVKSAPQRVSCVFTHLCSTLWNCSKWAAATVLCKAALGRGMWNRTLLFEAQSQCTFNHSSLQGDPWPLTVCFLSLSLQDLLFFFSSRKDDSAPDPRVNIRTSSRSCKVSESIWAPRCCDSKGCTLWIWDGQYLSVDPWILYFSECLVGHGGKKQMLLVPRGRMLKTVA